jgi:carbon monoxide dehydrogenase subunit G
MIIEGNFKLKAHIQKVWDTVLLPDTLAACIPGAEKIVAVDDKTYDCLVKQSVGPISVKLQFQVKLIEVNPPNHVKAYGTGEALGKMGTFTVELIVDLTQAGEEVEVAYKTDVNIVGKLATFGERIMRAKAKTIGEEFTKNLQTKLMAASK